jgi:ornithine cyclodeaminase/alanine dehydrogenase-like protein (mu-crystallin family)
MSLILSKSEVGRYLVMEELINEMEAGFFAFSDGKVEMPQRIRLATVDGGGYGAFMPCYMPGQGLGIKINTNFRENADHGLPRILGLLVLLDTATGMPLAIMDSTAITAFRTAAVSGVALRHLARENSEILGILGAGVLSVPHMLAASAVRPIRTVRVYSPHLSARQEEFALAARAAMGAAVEIVSSAEQAVADADIVVTCTSSASPVLDGRWLHPGTCIIAVGNATPNSRELDTLTVMRSRVICDSWRACILEAGDLLIPIKEGSITDSQIKHDLGDILQQHQPPTGSSEIVLFKSVGLAFEDLIAARYVYSKAISSKTAARFEFFDATLKAMAS